jgi:hypothetical protein
MNVRFVQLPLAIVALALLLAACGAEIDQPPTVVSTATPDAATPIGLTVGQLAERIGAGWAEIDRYRAVTTTQSIGSPVAGSVHRETVEEVILPGQRHQVVSVNGVVQSEIVSAGGSIYGRGPALPGIVQTNRDPAVWITINGNVLGPDNAASGFYQSLLLPVQPPYAGLSQSDRDKPAEELGSVDVAGQPCQQYRIVDTSLTGERVEIVLALTESGLTCSIQTTSAHAVTTTVYTYDQPAVIVVPASPVPAPAENG